MKISSNWTVRDPLTIARAARLACEWEATAFKPGNVHPHARFDDLTYDDFLRSAAAIEPIFARLDHPTLPENPRGGLGLGLGLGRLVLDAVVATRGVVATNTNLGILLLIAPLALVPTGENLAEGVGRVLDHANEQDAAAIFEAIRRAQPGGLGRGEDYGLPEGFDVTCATPSGPTASLDQAMRAASHRDAIARQYSERFADLFAFGLPRLARDVQRGRPLPQAITLNALAWQAAFPDTLIQRKRGLSVALEASRRAREVLESGWPDRSEARLSLSGFDAWLRADGHARNPGATADLVAATLFAALRLGLLGDDPGRFTLA
ncbi:triphosphoribosyl-dephospho-CoA protein [Isosphaera pallida ATCC 43644]|uniref:Triphosphoribosyl-dephospho-CoA protein n=1 Tax=Isosphaera pallida (strain ATCC 43644 / DSM 9630 / IS1B) TaxID=575540 RepID=E8R653_ISOPI|nr:triphosphoribosyl-dephospho-CoA synthase [Isosphaera pallida]ADV60748.1 triphosphoribosyl-dephospho-CoA protein [Isosphaera pallida ATCC 43644]